MYLRYELVSIYTFSNVIIENLVYCLVISFRVKLAEDKIENYCSKSNIYIFNNIIKYLFQLFASYNILQEFNLLLISSVKSDDLITSSQCI